MNRGNMIKGYAMAILSAFLFGCMPLLTNYIYAEGINRESVVLLRNLLGLPVLAWLAWRQERSFKVPAKALPAIVLIAIMGCCVTPLLLYGSYQYIAGGTATVFHFVYPAVVVLIGMVVLRKKISMGARVAVLLCVVGICMFYNPNEPLDWRGCILALTSGVTYAIYVVLLSVFRYKEISGFKLSFYVSTVCAAVMLIVCLIRGRLTVPATILGWLLCAVLALAIGVGAVVMFQRGTFLIGGERTSILSTVEPLTGVVIGAVVFQEKITMGTVFGSALVVFACILIAVSDAKRKDNQETL